MSANPIWIAAYGGPVPGAAPVWIAPNDGTVPAAVESRIASYFAPVAGASPVWIAGYFRSPPVAIGATPICLSGPSGAVGGGGGGPTSVWSAADAAANGMTLSNGGLTVTPSGVTSWQSIRGSISKTTGKLYVEFKNTVAASDALIGIGLGNSTINIAALLGNSNNYSCSSSFNGVGNYLSMGAGATDHYSMPYTTAAANDVFAIAIDLDAGKYWLARNNVWYGSGNPGGGTNHIMNYTPATVGALFPAMSYDGVGQGVWTLQPTAASQTYAPPSGFQAWG